ncbi:MAG: prolyl oligopeptidase family serine peptidase [Cyclobacteriaceae bacterium]
MKRVILLFFLLNPLFSFAQFEEGWHVQNLDSLPYQLLQPLGYQEEESYPLVIFLHGAGERGSDNELQMTHGSSLFLDPKNREKYRAFVLFPQCAEGQFWANLTFGYEDNYGVSNLNWKGGFSKPMSQVLALVQELQQEYKIDEDRIYVMGLSMGGFGTFDLLQKQPGLFAAGVPICGGADPQRFAGLVDIPIWVFHGTDDDVVPVALSREVVNFLNAEDGNVKYTEYEGVKHNSWDNAFAEKSLLKWLFNQTRNEL